MKSIMINPILPSIPRIVPIPSSETAIAILTYTAFLLLAGMTAFFISLYVMLVYKYGHEKLNTL